MHEAQAWVTTEWNAARDRGSKHVVLVCPADLPYKIIRTALLIPPGIDEGLLDKLVKQAANDARIPVLAVRFEMWSATAVELLATSDAEIVAIADEQDFKLNPTMGEEAAERMNRHWSMLRKHAKKLGAPIISTAHELVL